MGCVIFVSVLPTGEARASLSPIMALFLLVSVPFWYLLIVSFYKLPSKGWRALFLPFLGGLVVGMAAITITLGLLTRTPFSMNMPELYLWSWFRSPGWPMLISVVVVFLSQMRHSTSYSRIREIAAWLSGTAFVYVFRYAITPDPGFDFYRLFFQPFLWVGAIASMSWILDRAMRSEKWLKYLLLLTAFGFSSLIALLPVFYVVAPGTYAFIVVILLVLTFTILIFMDSRGYLS